MESQSPSTLEHGRNIWRSFGISVGNYHWPLQPEHLHWWDNWSKSLLSPKSSSHATILIQKIYCETDPVVYSEPYTSGIDSARCIDPAKPLSTALIFWTSFIFLKFSKCQRALLYLSLLRPLVSIFQTTVPKPSPPTNGPLTSEAALVLSLPQFSFVMKSCGPNNCLDPTALLGDLDSHHVGRSGLTRR